MRRRLLELWPVAVSGTRGGNRNRGLLELNDYFLRGTVGPHILATDEIRLERGVPVRGMSDWGRRFGDPALDPESDLSPVALE